MLLMISLGIVAGVKLVVDSRAICDAVVGRAATVGQIVTRHQNFAESAIFNER